MAEEKMVYKLIVFLLLTSALLISVNGFPHGPAWLGELRVEVAIWPLIMANIATIYMLLLRRFYLPNSAITYGLMALLIFICMSFAVNYSSIQINFFKGRSGLEKFCLQFIQLVFMCLTAVTVYNVLNKIKGSERRLDWVQWAVLSSLVIPVVYSGFIEIPALLGVDIATQLHRGISPFFQEGVYPRRLRSISGESSYFGGYIALAFPWLVAATLEKGKWRGWGLFVYPLVVLMCYLSYSRTVYGVVLGEAMLFLIALWILKRRSMGSNAWWRFLGGNFIAIALIMSVSLISFEARSVHDSQSVHDSPIYLGVEDHAESNGTRSSSSLAAIKMGVDHWLFGVGFGQYGFHSQKYLPEWLPSNGELQKLISDIPGSQWPPVYNIFARLIAETGIFGLMSWLAIWGMTLVGAIRVAISPGGDNSKGAALIVTVLGVFAIGLGFDSFRYIPYWLAIGVVVAFSMNMAGHGNASKSS